MALDQIDEARRNGARLGPASAAMGICRRTYTRWKRLSRESRNIDSRTLQHNPKVAQMRRLSIEEEASVLEVCNEERFSSLPPGQIVPILADEGSYLCSESTMYRILHRHQQVTRRGRSKPREKASKPQEVQVTKPGQCYCWDITFLPTLVVGMFFKLYCVLDLYSRKIVGWEIHEEESSEHAKTLINKIRLRERIDPNELLIHSDNGPAMKGQTLRSFLYALGITTSYSRPGVSDDNPFAESIFKTLKYGRLYPEKPFESIGSARDWMLRFVEWYNNHHLHSELKFVTPNQKHEGKDVKILEERHQLYEEARSEKPLRWSRNTRDWSPVSTTTLNPEKPLRPGRKSVQSYAGQSEVSRARKAA